MRKFFISLSFFLFTYFTCDVVSAQSVQGRNIVLKAGTPVELRAVKTVMARDVEVGDNVKFSVVSDVKCAGVVSIPAGSIADGVVTEAKKSSLAGTKGRLSIDIKTVTLGDGTKVPLSGMARVYGKNRTPAAVIAALFIWPCIFIPGTKAVMPEGYDVTATVLANTEIEVAE